MQPVPETLGTVVIVTAERDFAALVGSALRGGGLKLDNLVVRPPGKLRGELSDPDCKLAICDLDGFPDGPLTALAELQHMAGSHTRLIAATSVFDAEVARGFLRLKLSDFIVKPASIEDLTATILNTVSSRDEDPGNSAQIFSFFPAAGGVGNTTLALQAATILHEQAARRHRTTCVVDLNLQHGACAEYLDLEPRFDITEIENQPDRLDRQLLDVMLSRHKSGLAIVSAPPCPWELRSFRADLVARLLDLVSSHFDNVVIDMPRTWFPWTDTVLQGSDRVFLVTEMTVPAIRNTQRLATAMRERIGGDGKLGIIVNRADTKGSANINMKDVREVLGDGFVGSITNDYRSVREALDQGKPINEVAKDSPVLADLRRILLPDDKAQTAWTEPLRSLLSRLKRPQQTERPGGEKRHA